MTKKTKVLTTRSIIAVMYVLLICVMFYTGRTHTVLIDNKDSDGVAAIRSINVTVGKESADFRRGDRDKFTVKGQKIRLTLTPMGGAEQSFVISIPLSEDTMLLSIPKLLSGIEPYIEPFDLYAQSAPAKTTPEEPITDSVF